MSENRGKQFESVIRTAFERVPNTTVVRLPDPTNGYLGVRNICDFIIYNYPIQYFIECKTIHGNTFPLANISRNQWEGLLEVSSVRGVAAGILCWWVDKDVTKFLPIQTLSMFKSVGAKSIRYDFRCRDFIVLAGKKKRVFFEYDTKKFFDDVKGQGYGF